jgi:hypothetical protein
MVLNCQLILSESKQKVSNNLIHANTKKNSILQIVTIVTIRVNMCPMNVPWTSSSCLCPLNMVKAVIVHLFQLIFIYTLSLQKFITSLFVVCSQWGAQIRSSKCSRELSQLSQSVTWKAWQMSFISGAEKGKWCYVPEQSTIFD